MTQQLRKYEIDAMVDGICTKLRANREYVQAQFKTTAEYSQLNKDLEAIEKAKESIRKAEAKLEELQYTLTDDVADFNEQFGNEVFHLEYSKGYSCKSSIEFKENLDGYHGARASIASELTVALLPKDAKDNIMQIISDIADKFIITR